MKKVTNEEFDHKLKLYRKDHPKAKFTVNQDKQSIVLDITITEHYLLTDYSENGNIETET